MTKHKPTAEDLAAANFRKSSYSGSGGNECVEVAQVRAWACLRDSKVDGGPVLTVPVAAFGDLLGALSSGQL
ncbi:DUF397 domain-containing protein [Streptomyces sp. NPDC053726]|uniref:DUF397 domain-containing protein n=1 Tax=Streptomyces sp. NPDC053726 TaxID=3365713 RepID=UPI0037D1A1A4